MKEEWFADLVNQVIQKRGAAARIADAMGVDQSRITKWASGTEPGIYNAAAFLKLIGGDIERAMPEWDPGAEPPAVQILGQVQAGAFSPAGEGVGEVNLDLSVWRDSPSWSLTSGKTGLVQIVGDSMEPKYAAGEFLVCRAPDDPAKIPDSTPCIFTGPRGSTFKLLRRSRGGLTLGQPLNPRHEIVEVNDTDVTVQLVVLGSVDLGYKRTPRIERKR